MSKYHDYELQEIDEIIQEQQDKAHDWMIEDIHNALATREDYRFELENPSFIDGERTDDMFREIYIDEAYGIMFHCDYGTREADDLDYEQLHTAYEALKYEGLFNED